MFVPGFAFCFFAHQVAKSDLGDLTNQFSNQVAISAVIFAVDLP